MKKQFTLTLCAAGLTLSLPAFAQELSASAEASADSDGDADTEASADGEASEPEPEPESEAMPVAEPRVAPEDAQAEGGSDHEKMIGHFGVGYMGWQTMTVGAARDAISAPIIGVRYWMNDFLGIDGGLGFNFNGGKQKQTGVDDVKKVGTTVFFIHAGVPLNLADTGSFSFQVVPEVNLGFAGTGDQNPADDAKLKDKGFHASVGARAGAEIQFGFIGLPQLSLQGNVGLYFQHETGTTKATGAGADAKASDSTNAFGTTLGPDPWDLFAGNISALYYF
jgi:hypothetical protein